VILWHNPMVRRLLPWALVALVGIGSGLGAVISVASVPQTTPAQWVASVLTATARAGSAHFTYSSITTSTNPALASRVVGRGLVDFTSGDVRVSEVDTNRQFTTGPLGAQIDATPNVDRSQDIDIGSSDYKDLSGPNGAQEWIRFTLPRNPHADLGLSFADNAGGALDSISDGFEYAKSVRNLGSASRSGIPSTRYLVMAASVCGPPRHVAKQPVTEQQGPTTMWVDGQGRLVQVSYSLRIDEIRPPALAHEAPGVARLMKGRAAMTATLRFSDFGTPVHIKTPPLSDVSSSSSHSVSIGIKCASSKSS
jgi:hypothetical protein